MNFITINKNLQTANVLAATQIIDNS